MRSDTKPNPTATPASESTVSGTVVSGHQEKNKRKCFKCKKNPTVHKFCRLCTTCKSTCPKCLASPKRKGSSYCADCMKFWRIRRERIKKEAYIKAGIVKVDICPTCKKRERIEYSGYCSACRLEQGRQWKINNPLGTRINAMRSYVVSQMRILKKKGKPLPEYYAIRLALLNGEHKEITNDPAIEAQRYIISQRLKVVTDLQRARDKERGKYIPEPYENRNE